MHGGSDHRIPVSIVKFLEAPDNLVIVIRPLVIRTLQEPQHFKNICNDYIAAHLELLNLPALFP